MGLDRILGKLASLRSLGSVVAWIPEQPVALGGGEGAAVGPGMAVSS